MRRSRPWSLGVILCLAPSLGLCVGLCAGCPADGDDGSDGSDGDDAAAATEDAATATSESGASTSTSATESATSTDPDDADSGEPDTGAPDNLCGSYCNAVVACGGEPSTCTAECEARLRFRDDHFGSDCRAATEASLSCITGLTCDQMQAFACEDTEISEVTTCEGDTDPGPEVVAFCEAQVECDVPAAVCELAILQDFVASAYALGCEAQYAALLSCVVPVGCMATDPELEAACGAESDALDAACPGLFE